MEKKVEVKVPHSDTIFPKVVIFPGTTIFEPETHKLCVYFDHCPLNLEILLVLEI